MTDISQTLPIQLTEAELINIRVLGNEANAAIAAAQVAGLPPPVGAWEAMYKYIFGLVSPASGPVLQAPSAQQYWFEQAPFINDDQENVPSGYFVRDVTAVVMVPKQRYTPRSFANTRSSR